MIFIVIKYRKQIREYLDLKAKEKELKEEIKTEEETLILEEKAEQKEKILGNLKRQEKAIERINFVEEFKAKNKQKKPSLLKDFSSGLDKVSKFAEKLPLAQPSKGKPKDMFDPGIFKGMGEPPKKKKGKRKQKSQFEILPPKFLIILFGLVLLGNMLIMYIRGG